MNMNRIINMIVRTLIRRAVNSGVNFGINAASGRGRGERGNRAPGKHDTGQPQDKQMARRQRQAAKATRRIGKF